MSVKVYYRHLVTLLLKYNILNETTFNLFHPPKIEAELFHLNKLVKKQSVCIDIGANVGMYTCKLSNLVGKNGQVIAFEPSLHAFKFLEKNVNGLVRKLKNVKIFNLAIGNKPDFVSLVYFYEKGGRISDPLTRIGYEHGEIRMTTLDSVIPELGLDHVDFIKIDTEGYGFNVISGAIETISKHHPAILMEMDDVWLKRYDSSHHHIMKLLGKYGYKAFSLNDGGFQELNSTFQGNVLFR